MSDIQSRHAYFHQLSLERARRRKHRRCHEHNRVKHVCVKCVKTYCKLCGHTCGKKTTPTPNALYAPPKMLRAVWEHVKSMGALRIDEHPDSGGWMIIFPQNVLNLHSAAELADRIWLKPELKAIASATPFRAGRGTKPERHWWVSFLLKKTP